MIRSFTVHCPSCSTGFPIDPRKVPEKGIAAICSTCLRVFLVEIPIGYVPPPLAVEEAPSTPSVAKGEPASLAGEPTSLGEEPRSLVGEPPPAEEWVPEETWPPEPTAHAPPTEESPPPRPSPAVEIEPEPAVEEASPAPPPPSQAREEAPWHVDLSSFANEVLADDTPEPTPPAAGAPAPALGKDRFGRRDPHERARHLARVLVSDIIAYYPVRYQEALSRGTLKEDFGTEVEKSWREYVDQVGAEMAESTPYFSEALNEVLARGQKVF